MSDFTFTQAIVIGSAAAVVTAISGLLIARNRNRHEVRLKELDSQQKKQDFQYSVELDTQKRKAQAAELIVKQLSLLLNRIELQRRFYSYILNSGYRDANMLMVTKKYYADLASIDKSLDEERKDVSDLANLYFGYDPTAPEAAESELDKHDLAREAAELQHEMELEMMKSTAIMEKARATKHPITRMALRNAILATERTVLFRVRKVLEMLEAQTWIQHRAIAFIRKEMNYPETK